MRRNTRPRRNYTGQGPQSRKLIRWQEATLALALVVACIGFFAVRYNNADAGKVAEIHHDGELVLTIPLRERGDYRVDLMENAGVPVAFEVLDGAIRYVDVTCPDHICEKTGFISREGETAVCMPNRVVVTIVGEDSPGQ